jgi:hypothetical protein
MDNIARKRHDKSGETFADGYSEELVKMQDNKKTKTPNMRPAFQPRL